MTQPATTETVLASFDDVHLETAGYTASLQQRGDEFWVRTIDPAWEKATFAKWNANRDSSQPDPFATHVGQPPSVEAKVVMTTGSHHFQVYWIQGQQGNELWQFPWRYHLAEQRWVHRKDVFLTPPEWRPGMWFRVWNNQCSSCHSTGPHPGENLATGVVEATRIAELGISCEACHGPGEQHVQLNRESSTVDAETQSSSIVNPAKLSHQRSGEVCGQCHSHFNHQDPQLTVHGPQFRPGDNLHRFGNLMSAPATPQMLSRFWGDGANRSGGREFSGMSQSACFQSGKMSCVSCHSLHDSEPADQLSAIGKSADACLQCHADLRDPQQLTQHTHHAADSSGSQCYNCHMPHTNYALFKAIRSHQVDVPQVASLVSNSRPNACNLCHLDQTLQWTSEHLADWYGTELAELNEDDTSIAAGPLWALKGDAGQRVIVAWHLGWQLGRETSGHQWMLPVLTQLLKDPYAAVRWVAFDALRSDAVYADSTYEFDAPESERNQIADEILQNWLTDLEPSSISSDRRERLLFDAQGRPDLPRIPALLQRRDDRPIAGVE